MLYADGRYALLIVLQGRDASGKDGTIRRVFSAVNPQGCQVTSFRAPTEHRAAARLSLARAPERAAARHDRHLQSVALRRRARRARARGMPKRVCDARYDQINDFERMLTRTARSSLKFFLHVSRDEQRKRCEERLNDETKNWKFQAGDLDDRAQWTSTPRRTRTCCASVRTSGRRGISCRPTTRRCETGSSRDDRRRLDGLDCAIPRPAKPSEHWRSRERAKPRTRAAEPGAAEHMAA